MSYIGYQPSYLRTPNYSSKSFTGTGSQVNFTLAQSVPAGNTTEIDVYVANIHQNPFTDYTITGSARNILTFTSAPSVGAPIYVIHKAEAVYAYDVNAGTIGSSILSGNGAGGYNNINIGPGLSFSNNTLDATLLGAGNISGSGTINRISKFSSSTGIGNSILHDDGTNIGISVDTPAAKLHISNGSDSDSGQFTAITIGSKLANNARTASFIKNTSSPYDLTIVTQNNAALSSGSFIIKNGPNEQLRINSNGAISFGLTASYGSTNQILISQSSSSNPIWGSVATALGYTPYNASNPSGYISGITSTMIIDALGYTPGSGSGLGANVSDTSNTGLGYDALTSLTTGTNNTAFGPYALYHITSGTYNTGFGYLALTAASTSDFNTAIGAVALGSNTTGENNTAVGHNSLLGNQTGNNNTAVGKDTLTVSTVTSSNTAIGTYALKYTTGSNNTAIGTYALTNNTTGYNATAVGRGALQSNTTGNANLAIGYSALSLNTTGNLNTAIGHGALQNNTTSNSNLAIGYNALYGAFANTSMYNVAIGESSLSSVTSAGLSVAVGYQSQYFTTTGLYNVSIGAQSLYSNTTGDNNIAIGNRALYNNTTGLANVVIGTDSMFSSTTTSYCTVVGNSAGGTGYATTAFGFASLSNSTGGYNTAIGANACGQTTTATFNVALGNDALYYNTTGGHNNAVGAYALNHVTTGTYNTAIGYSSGSAITTGSSNVVIGSYSGNSVALDIRTLSNYVVLSDGSANIRLTLNNTGALGVGTTPSYGNSGQVLVSQGPTSAPIWGNTLGTGEIIPLTAVLNNPTTASSNITITLQPCTLSFYTSTSLSPSITSNSSTITLTIPHGAHLGTQNADGWDYYILAINNNGIIELAVVNGISYPSFYEEKGAISTTAISNSSTNSTQYYSTSARTNLHYRIIGKFNAYNNNNGITGGDTWDVLNSVTPLGLLHPRSSIGYGQKWYTGATSTPITRTSGTTYYNTTGKPITVVVSQSASGNFDATVDGTTIINAYSFGNFSDPDTLMPLTFIVPPGSSYSVTASINVWAELR